MEQKKIQYKQENMEQKKPQYKQEKEPESLVRILGYDIPGSKPVHVGLTRIKGISWSISHAFSILMKIPSTKKILELTKDEIKKIEEVANTLPLPDYLKNRRFDPETGETKHLFGTALEMRKDFDIKKMIKMRSYKGVRHAFKLPVRGQRTRAHFRKKGGAFGVKKKKV